LVFLASFPRRRESRGNNHIDPRLRGDDGEELINWDDVEELINWDYGEELINKIIR